MGGFLYYWVFFLILPGYFLTSVIFKKREFDIIEIMPVSFGMSLAIFTVPAVICYLLRLGLSQVNVFFHSIVIALFVLWFVNFKKDRISLKIESFWKIVLFVSMAGLSVFAYKTAARAFDVDVADVWFFLSFVKKILATGVATPDNPFIKGEGAEFIYGYNVLHLFYALFSHLGRLSILKVWGYSIPVLGFIMASTVYLLSKALFNARIAIASTFLHMGLLLLYRNMTDIINIPRPPAVSIYILSITALAAAFAYIKNGNVRFLLTAGLLVGATSFLHLSDGLGLILIFIIYLIFSIPWDGNGNFNKRIAYLAAFSCVLLGLAVCFKLIYAYPAQADSMYIFKSGIKAPMYFTKRFFMINPFDTFLRSPLMAMTMFLYPITFCWIRKSAGIRLLLSLLVCTYLVMLNPLLASFVGMFTSHVFVRKFAYGLFPVNSVIFTVILFGLIGLINRVNRRHPIGLFPAGKKKSGLKNGLMYVFIFLVISSAISYFYLFSIDSTKFVYAQMTMLQRHNLKIMLFGFGGFMMFFFVSVLLAAEYFFSFPGRLLRKFVGFDIDDYKPGKPLMALFFAFFLAAFALSGTAYLRNPPKELNESIDSIESGRTGFLNGLGYITTVLCEPRTDIFQSKSYGLKMTALTPHYGVSMFDSTYKVTRTPNVDYVRRSEDARYVFSDKAEFSQIDSIMNKYGVGYICIEKERDRGNLENILKYAEGYGPAYEDGSMLIIKTPYGRK